LLFLTLRSDGVEEKPGTSGLDLFTLGTPLLATLRFPQVRVSMVADASYTDNWNSVRSQQAILASLRTAKLQALIVVVL
jgi:hypothetical protein